MLGDDRQVLALGLAHAIGMTVIGVAAGARGAPARGPAARWPGWAAATAAGIVAAVAAALAGWGMVVGAGQWIGARVRRRSLVQGVPCGGVLVGARSRMRPPRRVLLDRHDVRRAGRQARGGRRRTEAERRRARGAVRWRWCWPPAPAASGSTSRRWPAAWSRPAATVLVCGPAATDELFGFTAAGAGFRPVEIPASPGPQDSGAVRALRRALAGRELDVVHAHGLRAGFVAALARPTAPAGGDLAQRGARARAARPGVACWSSGSWRGPPAVTLGASEDLVERATELGARDARLAPVAAPALAPPSAARAAVRAEFRLAPDTPLILSVGRLHPQKRYDLLVDAAARWRDLTPRRSSWWPGPGQLHGPGPARQREARPVAPARAPRRRARPAAGADLAVVTSDWEARQLFAQEALRAGVPLVTTAVGGLPGLVGDAAVQIPPGDVDALDRAVRELLADPAVRADYAARGAEQAAGWPSEQDTVDDVLAAYAEVTAARR